MTTGIYLLDFGDGLLYVGQSVDIEKRWEEHEFAMLRNKAATKLQRAFKRNGLPKKSILIRCHKDHLDAVESLAIAYIKPTLNTTGVKQVVTREDADKLLSSEHLLCMSLLDLIRTIDVLGAGAAAGAELMEQTSTEREAELLRIIDVKNTVIKSLEEQLKKPWWKKLLGI